MAFLSRTVTNADGATASFPISFPLRNGSAGRAEVDIYVHAPGSGALGTPKVSGTDFNWASDGLITFVAGHLPAAGTVVDARRHTLATALANTVQASGSLKSAALVANDLQLLYLAEEASDAAQDLQAQALVFDSTIEERARDAVGAALVGHGAATVTANDAGETIDITVPQPLNITINGSPYSGSGYPLPVVTPESFTGLWSDVPGADNGAAMAAAAAVINAAGGGTIWMQRRDYYHGGQTLNGSTPFGPYTWAPTVPYPIEIHGCARPVVIALNGARILPIAGAKYGTFDAAGNAMATVAPYFLALGLSSPYFGQIYIHDNTGPVLVHSGELFGNRDALALGGEWGNTGRQIGCTGLILQNNTGGWMVHNVKSHHHAQDSIGVDGPGVLNTMENGLVLNCDFTDSARNNLSLTGGVGITFTKCRFLRAGRGAFTSAPAANIDIEAEGGKWVTLANFNDCVAEDSSGDSLLFGGGANTTDIFWNGGKIVGTTAPAYAGFSIPRVFFKRATLAGELLGIATEDFEECLITGNPALSPTGAVYHGAGNKLMPDIRAGVYFRRCEFHHYAGAAQNGNFDGADFDTCKFISKAGAGAFRVYGHFRGKCQFIAEAGGTNPDGSPGARAAGTVDIGDAEHFYTVTTTAPVTTTYKATRNPMDNTVIP